MKIVLDKGAIMPTRAHETDAGLDMLENWRNSEGARLEYEYAKAHNYNILFLGKDIGVEE